MEKRSVRLSSDLQAKESEIFAYYGVQGETYSDKYRDFIIKVHRAMRLNEVSQVPSNPAMHPAENITILRCPLRKHVKKPHYDKKTGALLWTEQKLICVDNPPKHHDLIGIEVCEVCIEKFYGLARKLRAVTAQPTAEPVKVGQTPTEEDSEPALPYELAFKSVADFKKYANITKADGSRFCPFSTTLAYPIDCKKCKAEKHDKFQACQSLRASSP